MSLEQEIENVKNEHSEWKSKSRIIGRSGEKYCLKNLKCPLCNSSDWLECVTNEKSKDQICKQCKKKYQIKCKNINEKQCKKISENSKLKILGSEYITTKKSIEDNIDYIIILYNSKANYRILEIIHINSKNITDLNIIPRKPLSKKAKRAGWQGCYLEFTKFNSLSFK